MIFVTGGTGLVGSHLIFELLKAGKNVKGISRNISGIEVVKELFSWYDTDFDNVAGNLVWVEGDILDFLVLEKELKGVDEIYHCAAEISFNPADKIPMIRNNVKGTANLVNFALENKVKKFCHVSSVAALGKETESSSVDESTQRVPGSQYSGYSLSKFHSEMEVWRGSVEGLNAVIVNPSIIIGPGRKNSGSQKMFFEINKGLRFYTKGVSGFVDVRDVVTIMIRLMEENVFGERFCINSENLSYDVVLKDIAKSLGVKEPGIEAKPWMLKISVFLDKIRSTILRKQPILTKESAKSSMGKSYFLNNKVIEKLNYKFIPVNKSIQDTAEIFKKRIF